ncbi:MAG: hypothetical protein ABI852_14330 [Gemmatimonadaceae bacterium]
MRNATSTARLVRSGALLALVFCGACGIPFRHKQRHPYPARQVTAKEGISVLIAGSARCLVPTKEFSKVNVGQAYECNWHEGGPAIPPGE